MTNFTQSLNLQIMNRIRLWFKKEFGVLETHEAIELGLTFCHNVYGDRINHLNCRSIWRDSKGKSYRVEQLFNEDKNKTK